MNDSVKIPKGVNVYMPQNNTSILVMKTTSKGNMKFPNSSEVDIVLQKIYNETLDDVVGVHIIFKLKFKQPVKVTK